MNRNNLFTLISLVCVTGLGAAVGAFGPALFSSAERGDTAPQTKSAANPSAKSPDGSGNAHAVWDARLGSAPTFVDVTAAAGISFQHTNGLTGRYQYLEIMGAGVAAFDYDNDGKLDLYFVNGNRIDGDPDPKNTNHLYHNLGNWRFEDVTAQAGVAGHGYGQGCTAADYDGDGNVDLYITNYGPNVLYHNNGDGTFTDVTEKAGVGDDGWGQSACFFDYDGDGLLDLYVQNYLDRAAAKKAEAFIYIGQRKIPDYPSPLGFPGSASRLYRNQGDGTFRDVTEEAGLSRADGKGMGIACVDFDGDGRPDIFVANDTMENFLFHSSGEGRFEEIGHQAGVAYDAAGMPDASMGVDVADYDNDGDLDLIVPCLARQFFTLYRNDGSHFTDITAASGLAKATARSTGFDAHFFDYDNDGDLDLFFTCGGVRVNEGAAADATYNQRYGMTDLLLANDGAGHFVDVSRRAGTYFQQALIGRGSAAADLDNDGDLDVVVSNLNDRAVILRNETKGGHWLTLDCIDAWGRRNPNGISAWITAGGRRQHAVSHPGTTYLSQSDRRMHFGVGPATKIDRIEIRWPSGREQVETDLAVDRFITLREPRQ